MSKRTRILVAVMALCICVVACLCSFAPPVIGWDNYGKSTVTETDVENLIAIADFQSKYGSFSGYIPVACHLYNNVIRLYCIPSVATWSFTESDTQYTLSTPYGNGVIMRSNFTETGFGLNYTGNTATMDKAHVIFYRTPEGTYVKGQYVTYSTGEDDDTIAECAAAWYEAFKVVDGYETAIEEAESIGYESGYTSGFDNGYTAGYNQGEFDGLGAGFDLGYADGITDGYESGYDRGYAEGYIDGYDTGIAEGGGGTPSEPVEAPTYELDIPSIFDGMAAGVTGILSAFDIEVFGISVVGLLIAIIVIAIVGFIIRKLVK